MTHSAKRRHSNRSCNRDRITLTRRFAPTSPLKGEVNLSHRDAGNDLANVQEGVVAIGSTLIYLSLEGRGRREASGEGDRRPTGGHKKR